MKLVWKMLALKDQASPERAVHFQITEVRADDWKLLVRYGFPAIEFVPGKHVENAKVWQGGPGVAMLPTPAEAQAHIDKIAEEFKVAIARHRERQRVDGWTDVSGEVEA